MVIIHISFLLLGQLIFRIDAYIQCGPDAHLEKSSSSDWDLLIEQRKSIRVEGYCMKLCGVGYDSEADGYDVLMRHYDKTKSRGTFDDLDTELEADIENDLDTVSEIGPLLRKRKEELENDKDISELGKMFLVTDVYCEFIGISFDECMELQRGLLSGKVGMKCINSCLEEISNFNHEIEIAFDDMPPIKQEFEKCLDAFDGPNEFFDYQDKESINIDNMLRVLRKNGFVVIQNFFPAELMAETNEIMNSWDETSIWNNFTYSDFYSDNPDQLNAYENRLEIALPFVYPFDKILSTVHSSILIELMSAYGFHKPINIDFPASIMSRPGALEQDIHSDHCCMAGMLKLNVAIHDIAEESGPTSFCPCTHLKGVYQPTYTDSCKIRYHPKLVKAGTVTIYDQSMRHNGMANNGKLKRRYILDLSYNIEHVLNKYTENFSELATQHISKIRKTFENLNPI